MLRPKEYDRLPDGFQIVQIPDDYARVLRNRYLDRRRKDRRRKRVRLQLLETEARREAALESESKRRTAIVISLGAGQFGEADSQEVACFLGWAVRWPELQANRAWSRWVRLTSLSPADAGRIEATALRAFERHYGSPECIMNAMPTLKGA